MHHFRHQCHKSTVSLSSLFPPSPTSQSPTQTLETPPSTSESPPLISQPEFATL